MITNITIKTITIGSIITFFNLQYLKSFNIIKNSYNRVFQGILCLKFLFLFKAPLIYAKMFKKKTDINGGHIINGGVGDVINFLKHLNFDVSEQKMEQIPVVLK